ncbi:unnamed protein product [Closterium sp. NIES-54]
MRQCSKSRALVPLSTIRPQTSSPRALFLVTSLAFPLTRLANSFTTPPRALSSPLRTSRLTSWFPFTVSSPTALPLSPPLLLFLAPGPPPVDPLPPQGPARSGVSQVDPLPGTVPVEPGGAQLGGAEFEGAESGGAEPGGAEPGGTEPEGAEPRGTECEGVKSEGAEPRGTASAGGPASASPRAGGSAIGGSGAGAAGAGGVGGARAGDPRAGEPGVGGTGAGGGRAGGAGARGTGAGGAGSGGTGAGDSRAGGPSAGGAGARWARVGDLGTRGAGAGGTAAGGTGAGGTGAIDPGAGGAGAGGAGAIHPGAGGTMQRCPFFVPPSLSSLPPPHSVLRQVLSLLSSTGLTLSLLCPPPQQSQPQLQQDSPLPAPSPYTEQTDSLTERSERGSLHASHVCAVCTSRRVPRPRHPPVPGTHVMALRPSSVPLQVFMTSPLVSSLPDILDPESDLACAASPTVPPLLATIVTDPSFESAAPSALVAELVDFAAACRLDYTASLVADSECDCPPSVGLECALGTDVLEDRTTLAALGFAPSTADASLFLRTDTSLPPFHVLVYVDDLVFATADIEALALVKSELQKRHTCADLGELRSYLGLQITRDRARRTMTLTQSHMVHQVLQSFGFKYSSPKSTRLPTDHSLSAPPSDESVEPSGPYPELVGCLMVLRYLCSTSGMELVLGGRGPVVLTGHADASWVDDLATQRSSQGYTFSLGTGSISWQSTRSSSVLSSSCEAEIYAGAMVAQELRWLTYQLTDLGERPRSSLVLYVDNKTMIALC